MLKNPIYKFFPDQVALAVRGDLREMYRICRLEFAKGIQVSKYLNVMFLILVVLLVNSLIHQCLQWVVGSLGNMGIVCKTKSPCSMLGRRCFVVLVLSTVSFNHPTKILYLQRIFPWKVWSFGSAGFSQNHGQRYDQNGLVEALFSGWPEMATFWAKPSKGPTGVSGM